jgi:hypothetical protein
MALDEMADSALDKHFSNHVFVSKILTKFMGLEIILY